MHRLEVTALTIDNLGRMREEPSNSRAFTGNIVVCMDEDSLLTWEDSLFLGHSDSEPDSASVTGSSQNQVYQLGSWPRPLQTIGLAGEEENHVHLRRAQLGGSPLDLLGDIASRLTLHDYRRFCRVCTSWASVKSPYTLYLLLPGDDGEYQTLFSATDHTSLPAPALPALRGRWCVGSQDDWLATLDEFSQLSLLNLITREEIKLPSVTAPPQIDVFSKVVCGRQYWSRIFFPPEDFRLLASVSKVVFSPNSSPTSYTAVAFLDYPAKFLYTRAGDDKWTAAEELNRAQDVIYRDGRFLVIFETGETVAVDLGADSKPSALLACRSANSLSSIKYLVVSAGDLLQVRRYLGRTTVGDEDRMVIKTTRIQVFKWDVKRHAWVPVESLGDRSLLVGTCCSISFSAQEIPGLNGNRVYFTEDYRAFLHTDAGTDAACDVGVFRLEDGSLELCLPPIPSPKPNLHPPIWIILSRALLDVGVDCQI